MFVGSTLVAITFMGGVYAILPAYEADLFGEDLYLLTKCAIDWHRLMHVHRPLPTRTNTVARVGLVSDPCTSENIRAMAFVDNLRRFLHRHLSPRFARYFPILSLIPLPVVMFFSPPLCVPDSYYRS